MCWQQITRDNISFAEPSELLENFSVLVLERERKHKSHTATRTQRRAESVSLHAGLSAARRWRRH